MSDFAERPTPHIAARFGTPAPPRPVLTSPSHTWKPLLFFSYYRLTLALLMALLFFTGAGPSVLGEHNRGAFAVLVVAYGVFAIAAIALAGRKQPSFLLQINVQLAVDIIALTLLMHASGGLTSGLGILIAVSLAGASIMLAGRLALLYAALATIAVLGEQLYADAVGAFDTTAYTQAGLLGIAFFATALLSFVLATRVRESERLAWQRGVDLANLEQLNDYIVRNMQAGIVAVDAARRVRLLNEAAAFMLGLKGDTHGRSLGQISGALDRAILDWLEEETREAQPFKAAEDAPLLLPRFARLGRAADAGVVIFLEDAGAISQRLQQVKLASLGRLTASIAHEIRNPLGAISHAAQLLNESEAIPASDQRLTEIIRNHSRRMNNIIENVLQLSRRDNAHPRAFALGPWLNDFADEFAAVQNLDDHQLQVDVSGDEVEVHIDPTQLQQILWNLCSNALEHGGSPPQVVLRARRDADRRNPYMDVQDNGPGVPQDQREQIFEPFHTTHPGGTGLGLYIARELAESNGIRLNLVDAPDGGACFRLSFPDSGRIAL